MVELALPALRVRIGLRRMLCAADSVSRLPKGGRTMKKELLISLLALVVALIAAIGAWQGGNDVLFANTAEGCGCVSGLGYLATSTEPGAWIVAGDTVYLLQADYDYNNKQWAVHQLASTRLTSR